MSAVKVDLNIEQGATYTLGFTWSRDINGEPGDPMDLTGSVIRMQIRKHQQAPVIIEATTLGPSPMITHSGETGHIEIKIPADQTSLLNTKSAVYDLEAVLSNTDIHRVIEGKVTVSPNITQLANEPILR